MIPESKPRRHLLQVKDKQRGVDRHVKDAGSQREPRFLEADVALVWTRESWNLRRPFRGGYLRAAKSCRNSRRGNHVAVALLSAVGAVRVDRGDGAPQNRSVGAGP